MASYTIYFPKLVNHHLANGRPYDSAAYTHAHELMSYNEERQTSKHQLGSVSVENTKNGVRYIHMDYIVG